MLLRKIEQQLDDWKKDANHKPLIIKGCRQCGKTWSACEFAKKNYSSVIYLNFYQNPHYKSIFEGSLEIDNLVMMMSTLLGDSTEFKAHDTVIIFDEIQECPEARTSLKFFKMDGRYDVIGTGSLLGVKGYGNQPVSIPVGYESVVDMYPLDFEEFLWANGISSSIIELLKNCLKEEKPVPKVIHDRLSELLLQYTVVGGMPDAVQTFIDTKQINKVHQIQKDIVLSYEDDMVKYALTVDKPRIKECFQSIPRQLAKENQKFQYSVIRKGSNAMNYTGSLQWIEDAGIISRCYNLSITELPMEGNAIYDQFKVYMNDIGLFTGSLEDGTQFDLLSGNLYTYKGAVFENLIAETFTKMGRKLYYFHKNSGLEIDFCIRYKGELTLVEVKSTTGNTKSAKTILNHPEKYHVQHVIKIGNYNVGRNGAILSIPHYMTFLLTER